MSFEREQTFVRLRRRPSKLWVGYVVLGFVCAGLTWGSLRNVPTWQTYAINSVGALLALFFWLIPAWRFATNFVDVTSVRVIVHGGLFGRIKRDIQISAVTGVEYSRSAGITINLGQGDPLVLAGYSRPKALAETLRQSLTGQQPLNSL